MLAFRLVLLPLFIWAVTILFSRWIDRGHADNEAINLSGLILFGFFLTFIFLSLLGTFKIKYNEDTGEITFSRLYNSRTISTTDIAGYYLSTLKTRWKAYTGYILLLNDGSSIELTEYNVKPLRDFYAFVVKSGVPCKGTKNSWYPLKRRFSTTGYR